MVAIGKEVPQLHENKYKRTSIRGGGENPRDNYGS